MLLSSVLLCNSTCTHILYSLQYTGSDYGKQTGSSMMRMWNLFSGKTSGVSESIFHVECIFKFF